MKNKALIIFLAASLSLVGLFACTGCATGADTNYQLDEITYRDSTPFVAEDGTILEETTDLTMRYNQERNFATLSVVVDGTLNWEPEIAKFGQAEGDRSGGFYLYAEGYTTTVNNQAVADQTAGDTAQLETTTDAAADITGSVTEGIVEGLIPAVFE